MPKNNPWNFTSKRPRLSSHLERRRVLIVCEDSKSACYYFRAFPIDPARAEVLTLGKGMNTYSLVKFAIEHKLKAEERREPYSTVWCVFDRDSHSFDHYCTAFDIAHKNCIRVAWANQAFELWYLLHFYYHDTGIDRQRYKGKLKKFGIKYKKSDALIYEKVKKHQQAAIKHARRLEKHWNDLGEKHPERQNPSLGIHKLVEFLNELSELEPVEPR